MSTKDGADVAAMTDSSDTDIHADVPSEEKALPRVYFPATPEEAWLQQQLEELGQEMCGALKQAVHSGKQLADSFVDSLQTNHSEVKKKLEDQRSHLRHLTDLHYSRQMDVLKSLYQQQLEQFLVAKTEEKNYEARLADLQNQVCEKLKEAERGEEAGRGEEAQRGKEADREPGQHPLTVTQLQQAWARLKQQKPETQVERKTIDAVVPDVAFNDLQGMMGTVAFSQNLKQQSDQPVSLQEYLGCREFGTLHGNNLAPADIPKSMFRKPPQARPQSGRRAGTLPRSLSAKGGSPSSSSPHTPGASRAAVSRESTTAVPAAEATRGQKPSKQKKQKQKAAAFEAAGGQKPSKKKKQKQKSKSNETLTWSEKYFVADEQMTEWNRQILWRYREMLSTHPSDESQTRTQQWVSITVAPESSPLLLYSRGLKPVAMAPRPDGKVWMSYRGERILDLLDEWGVVCQTTQLDNCPTQLAAYGSSDVLALHSRRPALMLLTEGQDSFTLCAKRKYKNVAATPSDVVISIFKDISWLHLEEMDMRWVRVCPDYTGFRRIGSVAVLTIQGRLVICAADRGNNLIHFFQQESSKTFKALPPFAMTPSCQPVEGKKKRAQFCPYNISAHPAGFLAVLDWQSGSVFIVDVRKVVECGQTGLDCVVSVLAGGSLCEGVPVLLAFAGQEEADRPKLLVVTRKGQVYLNQLLFLPW